ncbi:mercuric transport protein MerTP [Thermoflavifilum thermophilum]|uniref:Mercuric transport protein MerT n=1 Tax=Thermoflavifilum thermophilum TaxID=1393122 RepID=A0A1I7NDS0_9BACT|nr:mercuric transport protein MerTP [Thermoflavifilum thermophilum]SFV32799.1 Copper chaperone CopZ [Thermoflavifilum thermophilum]
MKNVNKSLVGLTVLSAIAASLCCITPILAIVAGSAGLASTFSWLAPARPYLIGITVVVLGLAWYQHLRKKAGRRAGIMTGETSPKPGDVDCACETPGRTSFLQSTSFLALITLFAALALIFPYYGGYLLPQRPASPSSQGALVAVARDTTQVQHVVMWIPSMDCEACAKGIEYEVKQVPGVLHARVSYPKKKAWIDFDPRLTGPTQIDSVIKATGYPVEKQEVVTR